MNALDPLATILEQLGDVRVRCPEFRFGQLIAAIGTLAEDETGFGLWDVEDADFLAALNRFAADIAVRESASEERNVALDPVGLSSSPSVAQSPRSASR